MTLLWCAAPTVVAAGESAAQARGDVAVARPRGEEQAAVLQLCQLRLGPSHRQELPRRPRLALCNGQTGFFESQLASAGLLTKQRTLSSLYRTKSRCSSGGSPLGSQSKCLARASRPLCGPSCTISMPCASPPPASATRLLVSRLSQASRRRCAWRGRTGGPALVHPDRLILAPALPFVRALDDS